jgi:branched-chain amino acid transport system ATP-binding protein
VNNIEVIYDHVILVLKGVSLTVPRKGHRRDPRRQRRRQDHDAEGDLQPAHGRARRGHQGLDRLRRRARDSLSPNELVRRGCIQVMEGRHCFGHLTIEENLLTGAFTRRDGNAAIKRDLEKIYGYFPRLKQRRNSQAGYTSGGEQQMCAIGRALMSRRR